MLFAKILEEAGLPPGVLSVIVGAGSEIGDAFVTHPIPRVISFTGSTPVGRNIAKLAAEGPMLKRLELELGAEHTVLARGHPVQNPYAWNRLPASRQCTLQKHQ